MRCAALVVATILSACGRSDVEPPASETPAPARGVVLFVVDTLRADHLGFDGYDRRTSPSIDRLASKGTVWLNNYAQGAWTVPSMISMMTGLSIAETSEALPARQPVLAELLSENGVETAAFVGNKILVGTRGFARGFDHFESPLDISSARAGKDVSATEWVAAFERWHGARRDQTRPFFAWIHVFDPHAPYSASSEDRTAVGRARTRIERDLLIPRWRAANDFVKRTNADTRFANVGFDGVALALDDRLSYDGEVRAVDRAVQRLDEYLARVGLANDVLFVLASDHGEMLYEHHDQRSVLSNRIERHGGLPRGVADVFTLGHSGYLYREAWRTPLLMRGPGIANDQRVDELSTNLDILPTVLDALGVETEGLAPVAFEGTSKFRAAPRLEAVFGYDGYNTRAVLMENGAQLIELGSRSDVDPGSANAATSLLFDGSRAALAENRAAKEPQLVASLRERIAAWRAATRLEPNLAVDRATETEALRALGYLEER